MMISGVLICARLQVEWPPKGNQDVERKTARLPIMFGDLFGRGPSEGSDNNFRAEFLMLIISSQEDVGAQASKQASKIEGNTEPEEEPKVTEYMEIPARKHKLADYIEVPARPAPHYLKALGGRPSRFSNAGLRNQANAQYKANKRRAKSVKGLF